MSFYERLLDKIKENGETIKSTETKCGLANATIVKWKTQSPRLENIIKVAQFLNISIDWLIHGNTDINQNEKKLLDNFRKLEQRDQEEIQDIIKIKLERQATKIINSKIG